MSSNFPGWVPMPKEVAKFVEALPTSYQSFPESLDDTKLVDTYLWKAEEALFGKTLPAFHQTQGTCVSQGHGRFVQDQLIIDIVLRGANEEYLYGVATEPIYVGSRVEIGKNQLGSGQGSCGIWAMEWLKQYGVLFRTKYGTVDLTTPNDNLAVSWNKVPTDLENIAKERPIDNYTPVNNATEAAKFINNYYGVTVCSNQGFTNHRDSQGFDKPQGTWGHCMYFRAYLVAKGNRPGLACQQSWGDQPTGPNKVTLESGQELILPEGVFLVDLDVADRMLKAGDSFTGTGIKGFQKRTLDWIGAI